MDASFSANHDGKGHTGCVMMVSGSMVYASSRKQKICTKDSTLVEVVELSDNLVNIESVSSLGGELFKASVKLIV